MDTACLQITHIDRAWVFVIAARSTPASHKRIAPVFCAGVAVIAATRRVNTTGDGIAKIVRAELSVVAGDGPIIAAVGCTRVGRTRIAVVAK